MTDSQQAGADRFSGFGGLYDRVRPVPPEELGEILARYVGGRPRLVVDIGSGTGLSSRWASSWADEVIGIEPSDDMRSVAEQLSAPRTSFRKGWSHATGLADASADVVLAIQALHWLEPSATFAEVTRLLRPGGVFAAIDCDWPPVVGDHQAERAWDTCRSRIWEAESRLAAEPQRDERRGPVEHEEAPNPKIAGDSGYSGYSGIDAHLNRRLLDGVRSWSKSEHLERMSASGQFYWCREVVMSSTEDGDGERLIGLLRSQGDYQTLRRHGLDDRDLGVEDFEAVVRARMPGRSRFHFLYRARLGFKRED